MDRREITNDCCSRDRIECPSQPGFWHGYSIAEARESIAEGGIALDTDSDRVIAIRDDPSDANAFRCHYLGRSELERCAEIQELKGAALVRSLRGISAFTTSDCSDWLVESRPEPVTDDEMADLLKSLGVPQ